MRLIRVDRLNPAMAIDVGSRLGQYDVTAFIGKGVMGAVWRAFDTNLERVVAIKVLPADSSDEADRRRCFGREARAAAALNHPNICTIYEIGECDGQPFIAMEYVAGPPLNRLIGPSGLAPTLVVRYARQIADALAHAHRYHIIHRDLTASNVVVTDDGRAKVLDFGLAKRERAVIVDETTLLEQSVTDEHVVVGTPSYLAPELFAGEPATPATDIWALGVLLYRMSSGRHPFSSGTMFELSAAILREPHRPLPASVPAPLRTVIDRCLEKSPRRRYQQAREVEENLESVGRLIDASTTGPSQADELATTQDVLQTPELRTPLSPREDSIVSDRETAEHLTRLLETFRTTTRVVWSALILGGIV